MLTALPEIDKRQRERCSAEEDHKKLRLPLLTCSESKALFKKTLDKVINHFLDKCFLVTHDFKVLRHALQTVCEKHNENVNEVVGDAWNAVKIDSDTQRAIEIRDAAAAEKAAKKEKSSPGQKKIGEKNAEGKVIDDGATAEPASEVKRTKLEKVS